MIARSWVTLQRSFTTHTVLSKAMPRCIYHFVFFRDRASPCASAYLALSPCAGSFCALGPLLDSTTRHSLFNQEAWNKARNVLHEVNTGHCADPPDFGMYMPRVDDDGTPVKDSRGLHLYDSMCGTNLTECAHKQMLAAFGAWPCGVGTGDCLLSEWRHRYKHRIAERRRPGIPRVGHVGTRLVDTLQHLVQQSRQSTCSLDGCLNVTHQSSLARCRCTRLHWVMQFERFV